MKAKAAQYGVTLVADEEFQTSTTEFGAIINHVKSSGAQALLVGEGKRTVLRGSRAVVGRSRDCDLVLDDPNVSRHHAELRQEGGGWMVADLGSTNGIKVNGNRVESAGAGRLIDP